VEASVSSGGGGSGGSADSSCVVLSRVTVRNCSVLCCRDGVLQEMNSRVFGAVAVGVGGSVGGSGEMLDHVATMVVSCSYRVDVVIVYRHHVVVVVFGMGVRLLVFLLVVFLLVVLDVFELGIVRFLFVGFTSVLFVVDVLEHVELVLLEFTNFLTNSLRSSFVRF